VLEITFVNPGPTIRDDIQVKAVGTDPEGRYVSFEYQRFINDEKQLGDISDTLRAGSAEHGDRVSAEITPHDGLVSGAPKRSESLKIQNSPPTLVEGLSGGADPDGRQIKVSDPDDDPISFRLSGAPPNMTLDPDGTLHWRPTSQDPGGKYDVTIIADDGHGGTLTIRFPIQVTAGRP